jgi:hypothetical protein
LKRNEQGRHKVALLPFAFIVELEPIPDWTFMVYDSTHSLLVAGRFGVQSIPTFLFCSEGETIGAIPGALSPDTLREVLTKHADGTLGKGVPV